VVRDGKRQKRGSISNRCLSCHRILHIECKYIIIFGEYLVAIKSQHFYLYRSRSSIAASQGEKRMTSQSITKSLISAEDSSEAKTMSSSLPSSNVWSSVNLLTSDDNLSNPSFDESLSTSVTSPTSDQQSPVLLKDSENNVFEYVNNKVQEKTATDIITETMNNVVQKKRVIPASDRFASKKQKITETVENVLCQSSHALNVMATAYLNRAMIDQQQHPYITAIAEAMKQVPNNQQLTCFMSIMQIILKHS